MADIRVGKGVVPVSVYNKKDGDMVFETPGHRTRISDSKYPLYSDITIVGDRIIASTLGSVVTSIVIKSKDLAITLASLVRYINDLNKMDGKP
jgi:hypothetical protein